MNLGSPTRTRGCRADTGGGHDGHGDDPSLRGKHVAPDTFRSFLDENGLGYVFAGSTDAQIDNAGESSCDTIRTGFDSGLDFRTSNGIVAMTLTDTLSLSTPDAQNVIVAFVGSYRIDLLG